MMEVNLAIFVISLGLLTLVSLFPLGLRESDIAITDTHEAMFADHVLSAMQGNANDITNWSANVQGQAKWNDMNLFVSYAGIMKGLVDLPMPVEQGGVWVIDKSAPSEAIVFPKTPPDDPNASPRYMRFRLEIRDYGLRKQAQLEVKSGKLGKFKYPQTYFTDFVYMGM